MKPFARLSFSLLGGLLLLGAAAPVCAQENNTLTYNNIIRLQKNIGARGDLSPVVRITSPFSDAIVTPGEGAFGQTGRINGTGFVIDVECVTRDGVPVRVNEATVSPTTNGIRRADLLGSPNPNFPGLYVFVDTDLITPDGGVIPKNTNLGALFNVAGTDDTPGPGVTIWAGWHVLESLPPTVNQFTLTVAVVDEARRIGLDRVTVNVNRNGASSGQTLTPDPATFPGGVGTEAPLGPTVELIAPRVPTSVSSNLNLMFIQVAATDRTNAGIAVNEAPTARPGIILDASQIPTPANPSVNGTNRNYPGLFLAFDADLRQPDGNVVPAGTNLAALFDIGGSEYTREGQVRTTANWVVGGSLQRGGIVLAPGDSLALEARVTDNAGRRTTVRQRVGISPVASAQNLTPAP